MGHNSRSISLAVFSPVDPRRARTNAVSDVRLCGALASTGARVRWVVPSIGPTNGLNPETILDRHDVEHRFGIDIVRTPRGDGPADLGRLIPLALRQLRDAAARAAADWVLSRDLRLLLPQHVFARRGRAVPWLHEYRGESWERHLCRRSPCLLATNSAIVEAVHRDAPLLPAYVTGNPISRERLSFAQSTGKEEARRALGIENDGPLIVYTGKIYRGMTEVEYLLYAASRLTRYRFLMTGGQPAAVEQIQGQLDRQGIRNVSLTGFLEKPELTRLYQQAADVLVSYYSTRDHVLAAHNLPNKLAEYMATGNPVVVADFLAVRDLATEDTAVLVDPDNPDALVRGILRAVEDPEDAAARAARALALVRNRTFERVATEILDFLTGS